MELATLINVQSKSGDWDARVELLLEDAFSSTVPRDDFKTSAASSDPWAGTTAVADGRQKFLVNLLRRVSELPAPSTRVPYWSERRKGAAAPHTLSGPPIAREFDRLIRDFSNRGYFELAFDKDCVDDPSTVEPSAVIEELTGRAGLWEMSPAQLAEDRDAFCDLIEVLHDLVARPRSRSLHSYAGCGWHHGDFARGTAQILYRWSVNKLLERSELGLRIADSGEDVGRLTEVTDEARADLVSKMADGPDEPTTDRIRHAIALFRSRSATEHDKRSAAMTLALVLEERRDLLKQDLFTKDEGALFQIANQFAVRHQNAAQRADYDPLFRDWIFWWYLATIELTDRLIQRASERPDSDPARA